uniref:MARVEL domain-containing protein n=2 Tax=Periophthalmus magnuspinnatus TaxID=409849 RepID=A0A3B3ZP73_9GOBI
FFTGRGGLHMAQILLSLVTFIVSALKGSSSHSYWSYAMFTWSFCPLITLLITFVETFKLEILLVGCMDWSDFASGMAMTFALMTVTVAVTYVNFYFCLTCIHGIIVSVFAILCALLYTLEVIKDKFIDRKKGSYLAALPGFFKVMEAFVSCMIYVSLSGYRDKPMVIVCVVLYSIPFPILPLIIATNIMKKLKVCIPFSVDRFSFIFLVISVLVYAFTAIVYPIFMFKGNPRPSDCPASYCIWAIQFMVAFFTYVNLILFTLDLIFTLLGICGFKRT